MARYWVIIVFILSLTTVVATEPDWITLTGNCNASCYLTGTFYNVTLTEGVIDDLYFHNTTPTHNWACNPAQANCANRGIGAMYTDSFIFDTGITTTNCYITNATTFVNVFCNNSVAQTNWTFYEYYIRLENTVFGAGFRTYAFLNHTLDGNQVLWNGTHNHTIVSTSTQTYIDWDSNTGSFAQTHINDLSSYMYVHTWNQSVKTDFDYLLGGGGAGGQQYNGLSIGRGDEPAANTLVEHFIRAYRINETATGPNKYTDIITCFKNDPSDNCTNEVVAAYEAPNLNITDFTAAVENGNYTNLQQVGKNNFSFELTADPGGTEYWFLFKINNNATNNTVSFNITDAVNSLVPYSGLQPVYSYDSDNWLRITDTKWSSNTFMFTQEFNASPVWVAADFPYYYSNASSYIYSVASETFVNITILGNSSGNNSMYLTTVTNVSVADADKKIIYLVTEQHPSENTGAIMLDGITRFLTNNTNATAEALRKKYIWKIVSVTNPDGLELGYSRNDRAGVNLNREWDDVSKQQEVELIYNEMLSTNNTYNIDMILDFHSTLETYSFVYTLNNTKVSTGWKQQLNRLGDYFINHTLVTSNLNQSSEGLLETEGYDEFQAFTSTVEISLKDNTYTEAILQSYGYNITRLIDQFLSSSDTVVSAIPLQVENITNSSYGTTFVNITWDYKSQSNGGVNITKDGAFLVNVNYPTNHYNASGLSAATSYTFIVTAANASGVNTTNSSENSLTITTLSLPSVTSPGNKKVVFQNFLSTNTTNQFCKNYYIAAPELCWNYTQEDMNIKLTNAALLCSNNEILEYDGGWQCITTPSASGSPYIGYENSTVDALLNGNMSLVYYSATTDALITGNQSLNLHLNQDNWDNDSNGWMNWDGDSLEFNVTKLATIYYNATSADAVTGTVDGGTLENTQHKTGSYDSVSFNFSESAGAPGLDMRMNFTTVDDFNGGVIRYKTSALVGDYPLIQLWNYDDSVWEDYPALGESLDTWAIITQPVYDSDEHLSGGIVQMRLYKAANGNTQNEYYIDWVAVSYGYGTPAGEEVDPFSVHRDGSTTLSSNWTVGGYTITDYIANTTEVCVGNLCVDNWLDVNDTSLFYPNATVDALLNGNISALDFGQYYPNATVDALLNGNISGLDFGQYYPNATVDALITGNVTVVDYGLFYPNATVDALINGNWTTASNSTDIWSIAAGIIYNLTANLGIGTSTVNQELVVVGSVNLTGDVYFGNNTYINSSNKMCLSGSACARYIWDNGTDLIIQG